MPCRITTYRGVLSHPKGYSWEASSGDDMAFDLIDANGHRVDTLNVEDLMDDWLRDMAKGGRKTGRKSYLLSSEIHDESKRENGDDD